MLSTPSAAMQAGISGNIFSRQSTLVVIFIDG
jgi:hypothetical protein